MEALRARIGNALSIPGVLRIKGRAAVAGRAVPAVIQAVGARVESWFAPEAGAAGLVVIGLRDMDRGAIEAALNS
jgi:cobalamin biosynthesis protein CobW